MSTSVCPTRFVLFTNEVVACSSNDLFALAISGGVSRTGKATGGGQIVAVIEELKLLKHHESETL